MSGRRLRHSAGFTYIGVLIAIAILGIGLSAVAGLWSVNARREREQQLLSIGAEFREAIGRYYFADHDGTHLYPKSLEDLVEDREGPVTRHYLRRIYLDPINRTSEWGLVRAPDGGIRGVFSASEAQPLKRANFEPADLRFEGATCYCEWKFVFEGKTSASRTRVRRRR